MSIRNIIYYCKPIAKLFHTTVYCLQKELETCDTVLDLGCGPDSPIQHCSNISYSVGVEIFDKYIAVSKKKKIHNKYIKNNILDLMFDDNSFDAVVLVEVLEHLPKDQGMKVIQKAKNWASKKVIITTPNGFVKQKSLDGNPYQEHLSGWLPREMRQLGFDCYGLAGIKFLRQEVQSDTMIGENFLASIAWRPRLFWFMVATLSQLVVYHTPGYAFEMFCVYEK